LGELSVKLENRRLIYLPLGLKSVKLAEAIEWNK